MCACHGRKDDHLPVSLSIAFVLCSADTLCIWGNLRVSVHAQALQPTTHTGSLSLTSCSYSGVMITVSRRSYELFGASDSSITQLTLTRSAA